MTNQSLEHRVRRLEEQSAPALPVQALCVTARTYADAAWQVAEAIEADRHRRGWPAIIVISPEATAHDPRP